jgi:hypothetical protein
VHRVEMRPSSAPDEAVPFEARHYFRWYAVDIGLATGGVARPQPASTK